MATKAQLEKAIKRLNSAITAVMNHADKTHIGQRSREAQKLYDRCVNAVVAAKIIL